VRIRLDASFPDGPGRTILVAEAGEAVPWTKPADLPFDMDVKQTLPKLGGQFPAGFHAVFADSAVRFIPRGTDHRVFHALITRNGGEPVDPP
jgi:hypothetical protein